MAENNTQELVVTRLFAASCDQVWEAWASPEILQKWWGPKGFTVTEITSDFREDGAYLYCVQAPNGQKVYIAGVFKKIVPLEELVLTGGFADEHGNAVPGAYYGMDGHDGGTQTVVFEELGNTTKLTLRQGELPATEIPNESMSWNQSFDKLAELLS